MEQTFEAYVHKAKIPLAGKESIGDFQTALRKAVIAHLTTSLSLQPGDDCWTAEVYGDSVIVSVYKSSRNTIAVGDSYSNYYKVPYSRDKNGVFTFSDYMKVKRTEVWTAVENGIQVTKSLNSAQTPEEFEEVSKSLWKPVSVFEGVL